MKKTELGGSNVDLPGYDFYSTMQLGTIDYFTWTIAELETLKFKEVCQSVLLDPVLFQASTDFYVNLEVWEALDPELQNRIEDRLQHRLMDIGLAIRDVDDRSIAASREYGVEFVVMSEADKARFLSLCDEDWDRLAALSPGCAEIIEINRAYMPFAGK